MFQYRMTRINMEVIWETYHLITVKSFRDNGNFHLESFGDAAFNSTLTQISICLNDGANLDKVEFIDSAGGVVLTIQGDSRIPNATQGGGGTSAYYNLMVPNMGLQVTKGFKMKITVIPE